jgi:L-seryl-tRNA(Ser) seleniumtransferase
MHRLLERPEIAAYDQTLGRERVKIIAGEVLDRLRAGTASDPTAVDAIVAELTIAARTALQPVVNATGILLHTNLGRAPLASEALAAIQSIAAGYSNLEFDLTEGRRGSRYDRVVADLRLLTGAADALVVNNGAAALLLALDTFCKGREAIVSRGELVEIGGGFRIPDVVARSGAALREVGTTNRTRIGDFERALSPRTAAILRVHPSNFALEGFVESVSPAELAQLGRRAGVATIEDLGSGAPVDLRKYALPHERTISDALRDGMELVTFSGDKLLGGPQAGIVLGTSRAIARLRANPLLRALRVDKMTLAALAVTVALHRDHESRARIPVYRMLSLTLDELRARAQRYANVIPCAVVETDAYLGGGTLPRERIASIAIAIVTDDADAFAARLRAGTPPIVGRISDGRVLLDLRTIAPEQDQAVIKAIRP